jgi:serine O-acetyltransferase
MSNEHVTELITDTIAGLVGSYSETAEDAPNSLLGGYPNPKRIVDAQQILIDVMMPGKFSPGVIEHNELGMFLMRRLSEAWLLLLGEIERAMPFEWLAESARVEGGCREVTDREAKAICILSSFYRRLPEIRERITEDTLRAYEGDPAALSYAEVQLAYPGLLAVVSHRLAHELYRLDVPIVPRIMSEWIHARTGIDIHPGATVGNGLFIDHGTGVVIGETTEIGNNVKIYQGVTLGARSFPLDENGLPIKHIKRHPTVEDNVVIYANAAILGGDTVIGRNATIGANVFLMESVPPNSMVSSNHPDLRIKQHPENGDG